jgi:predicted RNA methylase
MSSELNDRRLGLSTSRKEMVSKLGLVPDLEVDAHDYEPSPWGQLTDAMLTVGLAPSEAILVDIGAGKGRVLVEGLSLGFRRVVGIEASPRLCEQARRNLTHFASEERGRWQVVAADAAAWPLPDPPLVLYLFNPFGGARTRRLAAAVEQRLQRSSRDVWVVHYMPEHRAAWREAPGLRCVELRRDRLILTRPTRGVSNADDSGASPSGDPDSSRAAAR